jgi:hypothetical protein
MNKENGKTIYTFGQNGKNKIHIEFNPSFAQETRFSKVLMNGKEILFASQSNREGESLNLKFDLSGKVVIQIYNSGGISVLPLIEHPIPNYKSEGFRILSYNLKGNVYTINVEGKPKRSETLKVYAPDNNVSNVEGGEISSKDNEIYSIKVIFPESIEKYLKKTIKISIK